MICLTSENKKTVGLFLALPDLLYKGDSPQSKKTEKQILTKKHPLSEAMDVFPFVVVNEKDLPVCRAVLTHYSSEKTGFIGFFEADNDTEAVKLLFDAIYEQARKLDLNELVGPIDCSIFIGYRFKTDRFDDYFAGEPYNKPYYAELWESMGFSRCAKYYSYLIDKVSPEESDERLEKILQRFISRGYRFTSLKRRDFNDCLVQVYELLTRAYSGFVGFKPITCKQFCTMFSSLKYIVDFDMVKLAYKDGKLVAFCICIPNYGKILLGKINLLKLLSFLKIRKKADEYIIMYLGADEKYFGIGSALVHYLEKSICQRQCTSIAALVKQDSLSGEYYKKKHKGQYSYSLYCRKLDK